MMLSPARISGLRPVLVLAIALSAAVGLALPACGNRHAPQQLDAYAAQAKINRAAAVAGLTAAFNAGQITADDAITLASDKLEAGEDAVDFAWAVLDMLKAVEAKLPMQGEFEIFWRRVGRLAFWAANTAYTQRRLSDASSMMLAGPTRWQNDAYWLRYPDHDALVAIILSDNGRVGEGVQRLQSRPELLPPADEVLRKLTGGK